MIERSTNIRQALRQRQGGFIINPFRFGGGGGVTYATWNPSDKNTSVTLSDGNLVASSSVGSRLCRATLPISGKRYFEVSFTPAGDSVGAGLATSAHALTQYLGANSTGYGHYLPSNDIYRSGAVTYFGATNTTSPVTVGFAFDSSTSRFWVIVQGGSGWEGGGNPAANTSPTLTLAAGTYFPACTPGAGANAISLNAGQAPFSLWTPSAGFEGVYS